MKYLLTILLSSVILVANSQNSRVIVYTEEGENFTLYINGKKYNDEPKSRVSAPGVDTDFAQIKVEFDISGAPTLTSSLMIERSTSYTTVVKKNKKGKYVLRMMSFDAYTEEPQEAERVKITEAVAASQPSPQIEPAQTTQTTTTTSSQKPTAGSESFGLNVSLGGETLSMNVNLGDNNATTQTTTVSTQTTSSSSSSSINSSHLTASVKDDQVNLSDGRFWTLTREQYRQSFTSAVEMTGASASVTISHDGLQLYQGDVPFFFTDRNSSRSGGYFTFNIKESTGVSYSFKLKLKNAQKAMLQMGGSQTTITQVPAPQLQPEVPAPASTPVCREMSESSYNRAQTSINGKGFSEEKLTIFKQVIKNNCVSVSQVVGFMNLFTYEEEKLDVAKLSYPKTTNKEDFYQVNDAFTFSESIEDLEEFLAKQ